MKTFDIVFLGLIAFAFFIWIVYKVSTWWHRRWRARQDARDNWVCAVCKREAWIRKNNPFGEPSPVGDLPSKIERELLRTPEGQWLIRTEAGAYQFWLSHTLWVSKKDHAWARWYAELTYGDVWVQEPINQ